MRILLLTPDIPFPSESGAAIRNWGIISGLAAAGHKVTLLSFTDKAIEAQASPLFDLCDAVHTVSLPHRSRRARLIKLVTSDKADIESRLASKEYEANLRRLLKSEPFDIVQFSGLELGGYLDLILAETSDTKVVYDALNAEAELQRVIATVDRGSLSRLPASLYSSMQARRLSRFENRICAGADAVIAVSQEDRDLLRIYDGAPITVMSNGIHVEDYRPPTERQRASQQLVFTGKMDYRPNVDAVEWFSADVLPFVRQNMRGVQLKVVGRNPHPRLQALAEGGVELTGWVESVLPYLHEASLFVVPLRMGSGTRLKILQAMAAGCAVVSTSIGAAGLNDEARGALAIADEPASFAETIVSLLGDDNRRREMGALARQKAREHYDWQALIPTLLQMYEGLDVG